MNIEDIEFYVLHHLPLKNRLISIKAEMEKLNIHYELITSFETITDLDKQIYRSDLFPDKMEKCGYGAFQHTMKNSTISLLLKHREALEKIGKRNKIGCVFEDDCIFHAGFLECLKDINNDNNWDVIFLGSWVFGTTKGEVIDNKYKLVPHPASRTTDAYLIKPEIAKLFAEDLYKEYSAPADFEMSYQMWKNNCKVYHLLDSKISSKSFPSSL
mgnify:CR=1 FL=1